MTLPSNRSVEICCVFVFAEGRPLAFLLAMDPGVVTEVHAVQAICPLMVSKYFINNLSDVTIIP